MYSDLEKEKALASCSPSDIVFRYTCSCPFNLDDSRLRYGNKRISLNMLSLIDLTLFNYAYVSCNFQSISFGKDV